MTYYLGIDGGGSKTTCAVGDETSQLVVVTAGPSNITRVGEPRARESLHQAISDACTAAGITPGDVRAACIGAAGAGRENVAVAIKNIIAEVISGEIEVVGDMPIALQAAVGEGPGIVVIAGTGSFAYGRNLQGTTARAGGWGFAVSDEGSAHWIGRSAVSELLRQIDQEGGEQRVEGLTFYRDLKTEWKANSLDEIVRVANSNPDYAALLTAVLSSAQTGDGLAVEVLNQGGRELARLAETVAQRLFNENTDAIIPLSIAGGVFRHSQAVREVFCEQVHKLDSRLNVQQEFVDPVAGALGMARKLGRNVDGSHR